MKFRFATLDETSEQAPQQDEVRFGSTVGLLHLNGAQAGIERPWTIVGVDEASVKELRIAFTAPLARALIGKRLNEEAELRNGPVPQRFRITSIT